jgi:hypothetical protein
VSTIVLEDTVVRIPPWVVDLASFRRWTEMDEFPEKGRICYLAGEVWIDMSREQLFTHNQVKQEHNLVLGGIVKGERRGRWFPDGAYVTNEEVGLAAKPDGCFVSNESLDNGLVRLVEGKREGFLDLEGSADMVLEIVSTSSVAKDKETLFDLYWRAGIREYWLVDVRKNRQEFHIFRYTPRGYVAARKSGGWLKSAVFGKSFRLVCGTDERGDPEYTLEAR